MISPTLLINAKLIDFGLLPFNEHIALLKYAKYQYMA